MGNFLYSGNMVKILDATLREGTQAPGVVLGQRACVEISRGLKALGVDMIECGHPLVGAMELARVVAVVQACAPVPVLAHARARKEDIDSVKASGAQWVGIFAGVNSRSVQHLIGEHYNVFDLIKESISYACSLGLRVRYTIEDGSRTSVDELVEAFRTAARAGADRLCLADTVGSLCPWEVESLVSRIKHTFPNIDLEVHFHDDRGMADANALAAVRTGADWISTSVNGLGERSGISDTIVLLANLHRQGWRSLPADAPLQEVSRMVQAHSRHFVDWRRPVTGRMAFTHTARLHQKAFLRDSNTYSWIDPHVIGRSGEVTSAQLPEVRSGLINTPQVISAEELRHHRRGPGDRYLFLDRRVVEDARQYCIVRQIPEMEDYGPGHVDSHRHWVDSQFLFIGKDDSLAGLRVEVRLDDETFVVDSPAGVFIPAGVVHSYRVLAGSGLFLNHVLEDDYNASLLDDLGTGAESVRETPSSAPSEEVVVMTSNEIPDIMQVLQDFFVDRLPNVVLTPDTPILELMDSLMFLDLFMHLEDTYGDAVSLDSISACHTFGEMAACIDGAPVLQNTV